MGRIQEVLLYVSGTIFVISPLLCYFVGDLGLFGTLEFTALTMIFLAAGITELGGKP